MRLLAGGRQAKIYLALVATVVWMGGTVCAQEVAAGRGLTIKNEFIAIRVNPGPEEAGRFAVDTTGGDPSRAADDNQALIYGSREPWTSYTTVVIDGEEYIFGGPTARRAGKGAPTGTMTRAPQVAGGAIACAVQFGDIEVTQELSFARGPTTRVRDAARIAYRVHNKGKAAHRVGLRVVLDAMLGQNDGAPLRAGDKAISGAVRFAGGEIPDFWQAFDSLAEARVISQGTLRGENLSAPDRLEMVDWGRLADAPWSFEFPTGADFQRLGEEERDTAVALYWEPKALGAGESRSYATLYGVGGVSLSPAQLSLGMTAPAEIDFQFDQASEFQVLAYVENSGGFAARGTVCELVLPKGLRLAAGPAQQSLGAMQPAQTRQVIWRVAATGEATGPLTLAAKVTSENLEANRVAREIIVNSPPKLELSLAAPKGLSVTPQNRYAPNPFELRAVVSNKGAQAARNLIVTLEMPDGLEIDNPAERIKTAPQLGAGGQTALVWPVRATGIATGDLRLVVKASAAGAKPQEAAHSLSVPALTPELSIYPAAQSVPQITDNKPTLVPIAVKLGPAKGFYGGRITLVYDPAVLEPLYISRGEAFVDRGRLCSPWSEGRMEPGVIVAISGERGGAPALRAPETTLFTVVFMTRNVGRSPLRLEATSLWGVEGKEIKHLSVEGEVNVKAMEEVK